MKKGLKIILGCALIITFLNLYKFTGASAKSVTVSSKDELMAELRSNTAKTIIFKTENTGTVTINSEKISKNKILIIDSPNIKIVNKSVFSSITINAAKAFSERASGNNIILNTGIKLTLAENKYIKELTITSLSARIVERDSATIKKMICNKKSSKITIQTGKNCGANVILQKKTFLIIKNDPQYYPAIKVKPEVNGCKKREYSSDGSYTDYVLDIEGRKIKETIHSVDRFIWVFENEYDENGIRIKRTQVNQDGSRYEHIFDENGREIKYEQKFLNKNTGELNTLHIDTFEYNDKGQLIRSEGGWVNEGLFIKEYEYNEAGVEIKESITEPGGLKASWEKSPDAKKIIVTDSDGTVTEYDNFTQSANIVGSKIKDGIWALQVSVTEFDKKRRPYLKTIYYSGKMERQEEMFYGKDGFTNKRIITYDDGTIKIFKIDKDGNWVETDDK